MYLFLGEGVLLFDFGFVSFGCKFFFLGVGEALGLASHLSIRNCVSSLWK